MIRKTTGLFLALLTGLVTTGICNLQPAEAKGHDFGRYKHSHGKKFKKNKHSKNWNKKHNHRKYSKNWDKRNKKYKGKYDNRNWRSDNRYFNDNDWRDDRYRGGSWRGVTGNLLRTGYGNGSYGGHPVHGYNHPGHGAYHPVYGVQNNGTSGAVSNLLYNLF